MKFHSIKSLDRIPLNKKRGKQSLFSIHEQSSCFLLCADHKERENIFHGCWSLQYSSIFNVFNEAWFCLLYWRQRRTEKRRPLRLDRVSKREKGGTLQTFSFGKNRREWENAYFGLKEIQVVRHFYHLERRERKTIDLLKGPLRGGEKSSTSFHLNSRTVSTSRVAPPN